MNKLKCPFDFCGNMELASAERLTTFGGGGYAWTLKPRLLDEFMTAISQFEKRGIEPYLLGGGSNTVIGDGIANRPIIDMTGLNAIAFAGEATIFCDCGLEDKNIAASSDFDECRVKAMAGARLSEILRQAREVGLGGLEFMSGVPATLGGALRMNASAFGKSMSEIVKSVIVLEGGRVKKIAAEDIPFAYRSGVKGTIIGAELELKKMSRQDSVALSLEYIALRAAKQPRERSCGSVFKNGEYSAGKLIEECGLKGKTHGGAMIAKRHANFIINIGNATASDFLSLVGIAESEVRKKFGVELQREFELVESAPTL